MIRIPSLSISFLNSISFDFHWIPISNYSLKLKIVQFISFEWLYTLKNMEFWAHMCNAWFLSIPCLSSVLLFDRFDEGEVIHIFGEIVAVVFLNSRNVLNMQRWEWIVRIWSDFFFNLEEFGYSYSIACMKVISVRSLPWGGILFILKSNFQFFVVIWNSSVVILDFESLKGLRTCVVLLIKEGIFGSCVGKWRMNKKLLQFV